MSFSDKSRTREIINFTEIGKKKFFKTLDTNQATYILKLFSPEFSALLQSAAGRQDWTLIKYLNKTLTNNIITIPLTAEHYFFISSAVSARTAVRYGGRVRGGAWLAGAARYTPGMQNPVNCGDSRLCKKRPRSCCCCTQHALWLYQPVFQTLQQLIMIGSVWAVRYFTVGGRLGRVKTLVARNWQFFCCFCFVISVAQCAQQAGGGRGRLAVVVCFITMEETNKTTDFKHQIDNIFFLLSTYIQLSTSWIVLQRKYKIQISCSPQSASSDTRTQTFYSTPETIKL